MPIHRHVGRPSRAATADREALAPAMLGDAPVRPDRRPDRGRGGVVSGRPLPCPRCAAPMYDPKDAELRGECLYCGELVYGTYRGYYRGRSDD